MNKLSQKPTKLLAKYISPFFDSSPDGFLITDNMGLALYWNNSFLTFFEIDNLLEDTKNNYFSSIINNNLGCDDSVTDSIDVCIEQIFRNQKNTSLELTLKNKKTLGISTQWHLIDTQNKICLWNMRDISIKAKEKKHLQKIKNHYELSLMSKKGIKEKIDELTKLPTNHLFRKQLAKTIISPEGNEMKSSQKQNNDSSLLLLSLTRFAHINECLGKEYGDKAICEMVKRIENLSNADDYLARIEQNLFALILEGKYDIKKLSSFIKQMQEALWKYFNIGDKVILLGVRIGAIITLEKYTTVESIFIDGLKALNEAKRKNINIYIFDEDNSIKDTSMESLFFDNMTQKAFRDKSFVLNFQPIFDLRTGKIASCEGLLRLKNSNNNSEKFNILKLIHAAEESGQIIKIGQLVMREACLFAKKLGENGFGYCEVKINVSPHELNERNFCEDLEKSILSIEIMPKQICIEITENVFIDYDTELDLKLKKLNKLGVRIAIDDFGTGYSNLGLLQNLPVDIIKLDHCFLENTPHSAKSNAIVASTIALGHSLGLAVIAEGIEKQEQLHFLQEFECDFAQGFFFSNALAEKEFIEYIHLKNGVSKKT